MIGLPEGKKVTLGEYVARDVRPGIHDYVKSRSMSVSEAMAELLAEVDFRNLGPLAGIEQSYLFDQIFSKIPFTGTLTCRYLDRLLMKEFQTLMNVSPDLQVLNLIGCKTPAEAFHILKDREKSPQIFVKDCPSLTPDKISALNQMGIKISEKDNFTPLNLQDNFENVMKYIENSGFSVPTTISDIINLWEIPVSYSFPVLTSSTSSLQNSTKSSTEENLIKSFAKIKSLPEKDVQKHKNYLVNRAKGCRVLHRAAAAGLDDGVKVNFEKFGLKFTIFYEKLF